MPGGKGANQAAAAARLGAAVAMIGRVGQDAFGREIVANLAAQGVQTGGIVPDEVEPSGIAMIVVDEAGENTIVMAPGANGAVSAGRCGARASDLLSAGQLSGAAIRDSPACGAAGHRSGRRAGRARVVLNPAPAYRVPPDFLAGVYALIVNETEAELLSERVCAQPGRGGDCGSCVARVGP